MIRTEPWKSRTVPPLKPSEGLSLQFIISHSVPLSCFPAVWTCQFSFPESFLKASSRSGSHSSWQTQTRRFLCMTRNPDHFGFFFSLSLSSITVLPGISSTSCYAVVCEEAAFPCLDPGSGQHVDLILGRDLLAPEVVLRAIRLRLSTRSFVLKPFWSICPHFCHEPLRRFTAGIFMGN